jgi:hypothetical protein
MAQDGIQDWLQVYVLVGGHRITGWNDGSSYSAVYDVDELEMLVGNQGLGAWNKKFNLSATITLEVLANSDDNEVLSIFHTANTKVPGGFLFPLGVEDKNGTTLQIAEAAAITKWADVTYSNAVDTRTWTIRTTRLDTFIGGTNKAEIGKIDRARDIVADLPAIVPAS